MREMAEKPTDGRRAQLGELLGKGARHTKKESTRYGKSLRKAVPRDVFAAWHPQTTRRSPTDLIDKDSEYLATSPFAFLCGAAPVMAQDLTSLPTTGTEVQLCGNAHLANFGIFVSPSYGAVFDIADFDETTRGPWEWDVARLAASIEVCGRGRGFSGKQRRQAVAAAVRAYREAMRKFAQMGNVEVWHARIDANALLRKLEGATSKGRKRGKKNSRKSDGKSALQPARKFVEIRDGGLHATSDSTFVEPLDDLLAQAGVEDVADLDVVQTVSAVLAHYRQTISPESSALVRSYRAVDIVRKVTDAGKRGTCAWIVVHEGSEPGDSLVLQVKEAGASILERYVGKAPQRSHGQRVVEGQNAIQAASDMFLGWTSLPDVDGRARDHYIRHLRGEKCHIDLDLIEAAQLRHLAAACGWTLAHAHARTGNRFAMAAYLGQSEVFDDAMVAFASAYADQNEQDYAEFIS